MNTITATWRRVAIVTSCLLTALVTAPAALAIPIAGTGGPGAAWAGVAKDMVASSPGEPIEVVRTVTETVGVGVPYLAAVAIGLVAFAAAWILATIVAGHRTHRATTS